MADWSEFHNGNDHSAGDLSSAFTFYHNMHKPPIGFSLVGSFLMHNNPAGRGMRPAWMRKEKLLTHLTLLLHGNLYHQRRLLNEAHVCFLFLKNEGTQM